MSVGFYITFIGLLTQRYIEQTPSQACMGHLKKSTRNRILAFRQYYNTALSRCRKGLALLEWYKIRRGIANGFTKFERLQ
jgi:hypothetical protein